MHILNALNRLYARASLCTRARKPLSGDVYLRQLRALASHTRKRYKYYHLILFTSIVSAGG